MASLTAYESSHLPQRSFPEMTNPSTRFPFDISKMVKGLQCTRRRCHCLRGTGVDKEVIARGISEVPGGSQISSSTTYIPFVSHADKTGVPSGFQTMPRPPPKVMVRPALSKALTDIRLAFNVGVWIARV